jgi:hypothetical protein
MYSVVSVIEVRLGVSLPSPEDGSRSSFRNIASSSCSEFGATERVKLSRGSECFARSPEPVRFRSYLVFGNYLSEILPPSLSNNIRDVFSSHWTLRDPCSYSNVTPLCKSPEMWGL